MTTSGKNARNIAIPLTLYKRVAHFCIDHSVRIGTFVTKIIEEYLETHKKTNCSICKAQHP